MKDPDPALLLGVPMSVPETGGAQRARLGKLRVGELPRLRDVDTADDAGEVAAQAPRTRFAQVHTRLSARVAVR